MHTPQAVNFAPSLIIVRSTLSPLWSIKVRSLTSTRHLRPWRARRVSSQFDLSWSAHGPVSRPCKTHFCSEAVSLMVILSISVSVAAEDCARAVPQSRRARMAWNVFMHLEISGARSNGDVRLPTP